MMNSLEIKYSSRYIKRDFRGSQAEGIFEVRGILGNSCLMIGDENQREQKLNPKSPKLLRNASI
jgi:hypothetical protein